MTGLAISSLVLGPERYMDLIIKELKKHPEIYPTKIEKKKVIKK